VFRHFRDELRGVWRKLHNEELHDDSYSSPSIITLKVKEVAMGMACNTNGNTRNACRVLMAKPKGKRSLRRHRRKRDYNIETDLR
jgi:hypothetical protein